MYQALLKFGDKIAYLATLVSATGKSAYFVIRKKSLQKLHFSETLADVQQSQKGDIHEVRVWHEG